MKPRLSKDQEKVVKELHDKYGGDIQELRQIVDTQFAFVRAVMEAGEYLTVRLPYLGKFEVNPYYLQKTAENGAIAKARKLRGGRKSVYTRNKGIQDHTE